MARGVPRPLLPHQGDEEIDPAERPLVEAGESVGEGFEVAEADLIDAETGEGRADPLWQAFTPEAETDPGEFSDTDHEDSSEVPRADR
jgi:hypothetical protein